MQKHSVKNPRECPLVEVAWKDHTSYRGWRSGNDAVALGLAMCYDVGYLLDGSKDGLTLAATVCDDGEVNNVMKIPSHWVHAIRRLRCSTSRSKMGASRSKKRTT